MTVIMFNRLQTSFLLTFGIMFWGYSPNQHGFSLATARAIEPESQVTPIVNIININDQAKLQRADTQLFIPKLGKTLYNHDALQLDNQAEMMILCADQSLQQLAAYVVNSNALCQTTIAKANCTPGLVRCPHRGDDIQYLDPTIPYVISPRQTQLLNPKPSFHWHAAAGATSYTLQLEQDGEKIWEQTGITATNLPYPPDAPPLQAGSTYRLVVRADTGKSSVDAPNLQGGIGFSLLDPEQQPTFNSQQTQIEQGVLSAVEQKFALAQLYLEFDLVAEGIDLLEDLVKQGTATIPIYNQLGDRYLYQLQLPALAAPFYRQVLARADQDNLEERANAQAGLGQISMSERNWAEAKSWLTQAQALYEQLGDHDRVEAVQKLLQKIDNQGN